MNYIIDFKQTALQQDIDAYLAQINATVIRIYSTFDKVYLVECPVAPAFTDIVESVVNDSENPIALLSAFEVSTTDTNDWWKVASLLRPNLSQASISYARRGSNAIVYMMDSGIKLDHPEFVGANVSNLFSFNGDFTDFNGHGTALTSVICGSSCGMTDATVKSVKIFQGGVATMQSDILAALDAILLDVGINPGKIHIVNMSWAIAKNPYVESKIQFMMDAGIYVVCSAGNNGTPIQDVTPASMPDTFTIGSYGPDFLPSDFSDFTGDISTTPGQVNYGRLDAWAPGENIRIATLSNGYGTMNGTSVAAAIQSAAIAFNSYLLTLSDGSIPPIFGPSIREVLTGSMSKQGILTISGQYAQSINAVTAFITEKLGDNGLTLDLAREVKIVAKSGQSIYNRIFSPQAVAPSSFDIDQIVLPEGVQLDANGWILVNKSVTEIFDWSSSLQYTTYDGVVHTLPIRIYVLPENMELTDPAIDEETRIQLQEDCGFYDLQFGLQLQCSITGCSAGATNCIGIGGDPKSGPTCCYCFYGFFQDVCSLGP